MKTPLDIYLQRHSPLLPELWLHYSRLSARYTSRHVPEPVFPYIPYLLAYPSGSSPALSSRRKNTGVNLSKFTLELEEYTG